MPPTCLVRSAASCPPKGITQYQISLGLCVLHPRRRELPKGAAIYAFVEMRRFFSVRGPANILLRCQSNAISYLEALRGLNSPSWRRRNETVRGMAGRRLPNPVSIPEKQRPRHGGHGQAIRCLDLLHPLLVVAERNNTGLEAGGISRDRVGLL